MISRKKKKNGLPIILDCEASGLDAGSYPIEIGIAYENGEQESFLLKPEADWTHWDIKAEAVHGIKREELVTGKSSYEAILLLNSQLMDCTVYSDCVDYDATWIDRLYGFHKNVYRSFDIKSLFELDDFDHAQFTEEKLILRKRAIIAENRAKAEGKIITNKLHRAGFDAKLLQTAYKLSRIKD